MKQKKTKLKLKKSVLFQSLSFLTILESLFFLFTTIKLGILPWFYLIFIFLILGAVNLGLYYFLSRKNYKKRMIGTFFSVLFLILMLFVSHYENTTLSFLKKVIPLDIETENYQVIVHKNSSYRSVNDIEELSYVEENRGVKKALEKLKQNNFWIVGTNMNGTPYYDIDYKGKCCIVIGNEGKGMSNIVKEKCDFIASIPMLGTTNSLNASVATGIVVFEAVKQRK